MRLARAFLPLFTALTLTSCGATRQQVAVRDVPRPVPKGWVTDLAGVIPAESEERINAMLFALRDATGAQVAVVTVEDVDAGSPKEFATSLFNHWGIGSKERNDGLLVLLVTKQNRLEIETGIGMEAVFPKDWLLAMQLRAMVPRFKAGDFGGGIEAGLAEVDARHRAHMAAPP